MWLWRVLHGLIHLSSIGGSFDIERHGTAFVASLSGHGIMTATAVETAFMDP